MKRGFTLIELLIVVAIIAILAAIAVPNFLEAQTRSKVSRVKTEMRTLAIPIEAYYTDYNKPPPVSINNVTAGPFQMQYDEVKNVQNGTGTLTHAITTPVAYMTTYRFNDPFAVAGTDIDQKLYSYHPMQWVWTQSADVGGPARTPATAVTGLGNLDAAEFANMYGNWRLMSIGPDMTYYNQTANSSTGKIRIPYDPTNGTVHFANIIRSHRESEQRSFESKNTAFNNY